MRSGPLRVSEADATLRWSVASDERPERKRRAVVTQALEHRAGVVHDDGDRGQMIEHEVAHGGRAAGVFLGDDVAVRLDVVVPCRSGDAYEDERDVWGRVLRYRI